MSAKQSEASRSLKFAKPYDGYGKDYLDDDVVKAVRTAISERDTERQAERTARADKLVRSGMVQVELLQPKLGLSKKAIADSRADITRLAREARYDAKPFDTTTLPQYRKRPYLTVAGSCVNRAPVYDWGNVTTWGAAIGSVNPPPGTPQNGNLGGTCNVGLAGNAGVTARAGIFFSSQDHCGPLSVTSSFLTTGSIYVFGVGWGACLETITLRTAIWGYTEGAWLADTGYDIANLFEWIGSGYASFERQPNSGFASCEVLQNRTYWIQAETVISATVGGGAGCDCMINTALTDIQACV